MALLLCSVCIGSAFGYGLREWRLRQLIVTLDREFAAVEATRRLKEDALLPVGAMTSDFVLKTFTGTALSLEKVRRSSSAILVNFWFYNCGPCQEELPLLVGLQNTFGKRGLAVISVNDGDSPSVLRQWVVHNHVCFPVLMARRTSLDRGDALRKYRVSAYPTNYLIDSNGRVRWRGVGVADEAALRAALAQMGLSPTAPHAADRPMKGRKNEK